MGMSRGDTEATLGPQQIHHDGQRVPGVVRGRDIFVEFEHLREDKQSQEYRVVVRILV